MSAVVSPPAEAAPEAGPPKDAVRRSICPRPMRPSPRSPERPGAYDLFQAMRRIEASHPELPLLGDALRPGEEPIRFAQEPALTFAPAAITSIEHGGARPPRIKQRVFGFLGPNGRLPIHLTEFVRERILHHGDPTFGPLPRHAAASFRAVLLPGLGPRTTGRGARPAARLDRHPPPRARCSA
jgi:hypothetical protein